MNKPNYDFDASCGGKRRGCCLIELPHDSEPSIAHLGSTDQCDFLFVYGLLSGGSPTWAVVSVADSEAAHELGEATR